MLSWESLQFYTTFDRQRYETAGRHVPDPAHLAVFRSLVPDGWRTRRRGLWFIADPPGVNAPMQGWKLHVTALPGESTEVLRLALPALLESRTPFKFLIDPLSVRVTGNKTFSRTASGKFITVYPVDEEQFHAVGGELARALEGRTGPYILSDRRWPGSTSVYYRYGGFAAVSQVNPDGTGNLMVKAPDGSLVTDIRHPYFEAPPWVTDPFPPAEEEPDGPLAGRYSVHSALRFGNRGGVYLATDERSGREVVLKEARPGVLIGRPGEWATDVLEKEYQLLNKLADTGSFVRALDFFREWEHAFLVLEKLDGTPYGRHSITGNPLLTLDLTPDSLRGYFLAQRGLWRQIAEAVAAAHRRGILLGDLSHSNVMVDPELGTCRLLDLETAVREGRDTHLGIYTMGLASPRLVATDRYDRANDWHALGGLIFSSVMLLNSTTGFHRPTLPRFLESLAGDLDLPVELVELIRDLTDEQAQDADFDPDGILKRIDALPFEQHWTEAVPLAKPALLTHHDPERLPGLRDAELAELTDQVAAYAEAAADPQREDRLFPADPLVFNTNPLSVAYGALGVLYGLHRLRGEVPRRLVGWALSRDVNSANCPPGLYVGQSGLAWVYDELGHPEVAAALMDRAREHPLRFAESGVLHGAAGYGLACLHLWRRQGDERLLEDARAAGRALADSCLRDEQGVRWPEPRTRIGYGYGASGVALFLLYLHRATGEQHWYELGREALGFDLSQGTLYNDRCYAFRRHAREDSDGDVVLRNYWDEGTAGVTSTVLRYLAVRPDAELISMTPELLNDLIRKYTVFPQLFHGQAGIGNVLLDAYELLGDERWLAEARRIAQGLLLSRIERPGGVVFPGEQALRESVDYATGSIGVALFLDRLRKARPGGRTNFNFTVDGLLP